jgi:hypothetical protein
MLASPVAVAGARDGLVEWELDVVDAPLPLALLVLKAEAEAGSVVETVGVPLPASAVWLAYSEPAAETDGAALAVAHCVLLGEPPPPREAVALLLRATVPVGRAPLREGAAVVVEAALRVAQCGDPETAAVALRAPDALEHPVALAEALGEAVAAALALDDAELLSEAVSEGGAVPVGEGKGDGEALPGAVAVPVPPPTPTPLPVGAPEAVAL